MTGAGRTYRLFAILLAVTALLFVVDMTVGATSLSIVAVWDALWGDADPTTVKIVRSIRLIKALVAVLAGAALSVSGMQMQTLFRNPLAGPYVLGISSGASLGVALFILGAPLLGASAVQVQSLGVAGAAWAGAAAVLLVIAAVSARMKDIMVVLILGMMFSSGVGAVVQVLQYLSREEALKSFVVWTMGSLGEVTAPQLVILAAAVAAGLLTGIAALKPLNLLMLGEQYAATMGVDLRRSRAVIFISTTLLAGTVTAFCGPIGFVGLAVPHVVRTMFGNADCRVVMPGCIVLGACTMLVCDILSKAGGIPINAVTALLGIPVVVWIVLKNRN